MTVMPTVYLIISHIGFALWFIAGVSVGKSLKK
jgi:hypothetical protein